ncbi:hypothetical protein [Flavobacterium succinicans]|uniref:Uncharacterized protein n=1 Tax=Flavobacterium succinicans TaxID=29536 RepID=A0A199XT74_9FLAO|nr:hypothetical protein [Flavobacterium succinicans]OAZ04953.1 hypothetical protein FLB_08010 [Flavobacterium succinicans]
MISIQNTTIDDLGFVYHLFEEAIHYQKKEGFPVWDGYDKNVLKADIKENLQYKIVEIIQLYAFLVFAFMILLFGEKKRKRTRFICIELWLIQNVKDRNNLVKCFLGQ